MANTDKKTRQLKKICQACGDLAKGLNYGGPSCNCCKDFFRCTARKRELALYRCNIAGDCNIGVDTRKLLTACRFDKCTSIGMNKNLVMTKEEAIQLNQRRLRKRPATEVPSYEHIFTADSYASSSATTSHQADREILPLSTELEYGNNKRTCHSLPRVEVSFTDAGLPVCVPFGNTCISASTIAKTSVKLTLSEMQEIESLLISYYEACIKTPYERLPEICRANTLDVVGLFVTTLCQLANFAQLNHDYASLCQTDRRNVLKAVSMQICFLLEAVCFDGIYLQWPYATVRNLLNFPTLWMEDIRYLVPIEVNEAQMSVLWKMKMMRMDESVCMLLIMKILSSECASVIKEGIWFQPENKYLMLLKKYVSHKFGQEEGSRLYLQYITMLADLRELSNLFRNCSLIADRESLIAIKQRYVCCSEYPHVTNNF